MSSGECVGVVVMEESVSPHYTDWQLGLSHVLTANSLLARAPEFGSVRVGARTIWDDRGIR